MTPLIDLFYAELVEVMLFVESYYSSTSALCDLGALGGGREETDLLKLEVIAFMTTST